jgi:hypothetical protein
MFVGRIEWTQYKFKGDAEVVSPQKYEALREMSAEQLEELLGHIRQQRWTQFRNDHRILLWVAVIAAACVVLAFVAPFFGIIAFFGWVCVLSLGLSAGSHSTAVGKEFHFLRRAHQIAANSSSYDAFSEAYLQRIAKFQLLHPVKHYYAIEMSGETEREKYAAQNTFVVLKWPADWNETGEITSFPPSGAYQSNCVKIRIHSTNHVRMRLIETSASLKFDSRSKATAEEHIRRFEQTFQEEFKKWGICNQER